MDQETGKGFRILHHGIRHRIALLDALFDAIDGSGQCFILRLIRQHRKSVYNCNACRNHAHELTAENA